MSDRLRPKAITQPTASHRVIRRLLRGEFGFGRTLLWFFLGGHVALELISRLVPDLSGKGWLLVAASPAQALVLRGLWRSAGAIARPALKRLAQGLVVVGWLMLVLTALARTASATPPARNARPQLREAAI